MSIGRTLIDRIGQFAQKSPASAMSASGKGSDPFEARLERLHKREDRLPLRPMLFRMRSAHLAA